MNHIIKTTPLVVIGFFFMILTNNSIQAQESTAQQLVGTWLFDEQSSFATIDPVYKMQMDSLPQFKSQLESAYRGRKIIFGADNSYTTLLADGRQASGTWSLDVNNKIRVLDPVGNAYLYELAQFNGTHMVLIPITQGNTKSTIAQWHFVKL